MATTHPTAPGRRRNARGEGDKLREQLLAATVALLDAEGDASRVSVRAIARAAGVSPTALYLHFHDREALIEAAVDRSFAAFNAALLAAAAGQHQPEARLRAMGLAYLNFATRQPALYSVLFSTRRPTRSASAPPDATGRVGRDEALDELAATLVASTPTTPPAEARALALSLWAALHGYAMLRTTRPEHAWPDAPAYVDRLTRAHLGR